MTKKTLSIAAMLLLCAVQAFCQYSKELEKLAKKDDLEAMLALGDAYATGNGVEKNAEQAAKWYKKAAKKHSSEAYWKMAGLYTSWDGITKDHNEYLNWLVKGAKDGCGDISLFIGKQLYTHAEGFRFDPDLACYYFKKALEDGCTDALPYAATAYIVSYMPDYFKALELIEKAEAEGVKPEDEAFFKSARALVKWVLQRECTQQNYDDMTDGYHILFSGAFDIERYPGLYGNERLQADIAKFNLHSCNEAYSNCLIGLALVVIGENSDGLKYLAKSAEQGFVDAAVSCLQLGYGPNGTLGYDPVSPIIKLGRLSSNTANTSKIKPNGISREDMMKIAEESKYYRLMIYDAGYREEINNDDIRYKNEYRARAADQRAIFERLKYAVRNDDKTTAQEQLKRFKTIGYTNLFISMKAVDDRQSLSLLELYNQIARLGYTYLVNYIDDLVDIDPMLVYNMVTSMQDNNVMSTYSKDEMIKLLQMSKDNASPEYIELVDKRLHDEFGVR